MTQPWALYSEFDPFAAAWLRNLIAAGAIAPGLVDERDLWDLTAYDCRGFTQLHLCAGIGVWSYAARCARWRDERRLISASFPCQPFSAAGKGLGFADERHLWPAGYHLFGELRADDWWADSPVVIVGEQVASKDGLAWLDVVQTDMESAGHAFGAVDFCAASVGAPHIRQRTYWLAYADGEDSRTGFRDRESGRIRSDVAACNRDAGVVADSDQPGPQGRLGMSERADQYAARSSSVADGLVDTGYRQFQRDGMGGTSREIGRALRDERFRPDDRHASATDRPGPTNGAWRDADWLYCRDERWRPVEPGTFPLANGTANRVGLLRGYGNAIVAPQAQEFIEVVMECMP